MEESDGVMYSDEEARWNDSRLLHEQERLFISLPVPVPWMAGLVLRSVVALLGFVAVRSQCLLMKMGMSENALKRWVLIWALGEC